MATLDDILTAAKNIVTAINGAAQTYRAVQGISSLEAISTATLIKASAGRVATVSVLVGGAVGAIYDAASASSTSAKLYVIPNTVGAYVVNMPTDTGIVVAPGSGQVVTVSWS